MSWLRCWLTGHEPIRSRRDDGALGWTCSRCLLDLGVTVLETDAALLASLRRQAERAARRRHFLARGEQHKRRRSA